jgi:hypothetical protein
MEKEKRERWIKVRVSETEKSVIDEKSRLAGVTTAALIRESLCRVRTWTIKDKAIEREKIREISRIGQNLNQIARFCNQHKSSADTVQILSVLIAIEKKLASFSIPPLTDKGSSDDAH